MAARLVAFLFALAITAGVVILVLGRSAAGTAAPSPSATFAAGTPVVSPSALAGEPTAGSSESAVPDLPTLPAGSPGRLIADPALLAVLPKSVGTSEVTRDTAQEAEALANTSLAIYARAIAAATVGDDGNNVATLLLAERRPSVPMDAWFPHYRADYDIAACDPLDGPGARKTLQIGGRTVETPACMQGGTVYHVILRGGTTLLSILELGPDGFGRKILEGLAAGS